MSLCAREKVRERFENAWERSLSLGKTLLGPITDIMLERLQNAHFIYTAARLVFLLAEVDEFGLVNFVELQGLRYDVVAHDTIVFDKMFDVVELRAVVNCGLKELKAMSKGIVAWQAATYHFLGLGDHVIEISPSFHFGLIDFPIGLEIVK